MNKVISKVKYGLAAKFSVIAILPVLILSLLLTQNFSGTFHIGLSKSNIIFSLNTPKVSAFYVTMIILAATIVATIIIVNLMIRPIKHLVTSAERISLGDFSHPVSIKSKDEIGMLAESFNKMMDDLKQLHAEIEQSAKQLRNIFENVEVGIIEIKDDCSISYANPKAKGYLNIDNNPQKSRVCSVFSNSDGNANECDNCVIKRCLGLGGSVKCDIDYNNRQFSGTITLTQVNGSRKLVAMLIDVTEEIQLQKQLIQSERIGALGRMASGVAHDFNNILAGILGRAELMLMDHEDNGEYKDGLQIIRQVALDGANTVRRIQEFTGVAKQKEFAPIKVNPLIQDIIKITEPRWKDQLQRDGIKVDVSMELNSLLTVAGNESDLREVLTNMVFNALDAMPNGGSLKFKTYDEEGEVCIFIADTGIGIPPAAIGSIFEPFFTSKGAGHSGLGLSACYGIINRHGGKIDVTSDVGKGTTFIIRLKVCTENIETEKKADTSDVSVDTIGANILVIDDEEPIRKVLNSLLTKFNNNVTTASDGFSGVKAFQEGDFDIVFTDLGMPGMSGWEVAKQVKAMDPKIKVILLTGWGVELDEWQQTEKDIDLVIAKPFRVNQILESIPNLICRGG